MNVGLLSSESRTLPSIDQEPNEDKQLVFMFSGQGSQYHHMAHDLYMNDPTFRADLIGLDRHFKKRVGESALERLYDVRVTKEQPLKRMLFAHAAIYMVEYCLTQLMHRNNLHAHYYLGASLGEFTAMTLSSGVPPTEVINVLVEHSKVCEEHLDEGGMLAILGDVEMRSKLLDLFPRLELASINFHNHFVMSSDALTLDQVKRYLDQEKVLHQSVAVSFAYHSSQFDTIKHHFNSCMIDEIVKFETPCVSCSERAILYGGFAGLTWNVIRKPIAFEETFRNFSKRGSFSFIDLGPSGTLSVFAKNILGTLSTSSSYHSLLTPYGGDLKNLSNLMTELDSHQTTGVDQ